MITRIQLIRNVGQFDSIAPAPNVQLAPLTLVYAENGRGKTTLQPFYAHWQPAIRFPSQSGADSAAQNPPHVVVEATGGPPLQCSKTTRGIGRLRIWPSSMTCLWLKTFTPAWPSKSDHRQNLHELILGAQGVALNQRLQQLVGQIEVHNAALKRKVLQSLWENVALFPWTSFAAFRLARTSTLQFKVQSEPWPL